MDFVKLLEDAIRWVPCAKVHTKKINGTTVEFSCSYVGPTADFEDFLIERLGKDLPAGTAIPVCSRL